MGRWLVSCGAGGQIHQFCASPDLPADRPYLASAVHWQRQPDSTDVIGGGNVASGVPRWAGAGRGEQSRGPVARQRDSPQVSALLSAPGDREMIERLSTFVHGTLQ